MSQTKEKSGLRLLSEIVIPLLSIGLGIAGYISLYYGRITIHNICCTTPSLAIFIDEEQVGMIKEKNPIGTYIGFTKLVRVGDHKIKVYTIDNNGNPQNLYDEVNLDITNRDAIYNIKNKYPFCTGKIQIVLPKHLLLNESKIYIDDSLYLTIKNNYHLHYKENPSFEVPTGNHIVELQSTYPSNLNIEDIPIKESIASRSNEEIVLKADFFERDIKGGMIWNIYLK